MPGADTQWQLFKEEDHIEVPVLINKGDARLTECESGEFHGGENLAQRLNVHGFGIGRQVELQGGDAAIVVQEREQVGDASRVVGMIVKVDVERGQRGRGGEGEEMMCSAGEEESTRVQKQEAGGGPLKSVDVERGENQGQVSP